MSNLVKHAGGGNLLVKLTEEHGLEGLELIAIDDGPGITDISKMMVDGVSTKKTLGHGLGAISRLSNFLQVYSQKDWGTILVARVFKKEPPAFQKAGRETIRSIVIAKHGEEQCGDGFFSVSTKTHIKLLLGDGLGHGPEAAKAVQKAGAAFLEYASTDPVDIIRYINHEVRKTRGLVGTVAVFDRVTKSWRFCGVGNITTLVHSPGNIKYYRAYNGIIGLNVPNTLNAQEMMHEKGQQIIMCSDGLKSRLDLLKFVGIQRYDLSVMGAALLKEFGRNTDDSSIAICKINL